MVNTIYRPSEGFLGHRGTSKSSILDWDFPSETIHLGVPPFVETLISVISGTVYWDHGHASLPASLPLERLLTSPVEDRLCAGRPSRVVRGIKAPDNPTSQLLPTSRNKKFKRDGEGRIDKGGGGSIEKLYVKSCVCVCDKVACVPDGV